MGSPHDINRFLHQSPLQKLFGTGAFGNFMVYSVGILALFTFVSNMVTWTMGASRAAQEAATTGELPAAVAKEDTQCRTPTGANNITGIVSTFVVVLYGLVLTMMGSATGDELFWTAFAFSSCIFLLPYPFMFPSYLRLRAIDTGTERPFRVPAGSLVQYLLAGIAFLFVVQAVLLFIFPEIFSGVVDWAYTLPVAAGVLITIGVGEYLLSGAEKRMSQMEAETPAE
ncbi:amino acid permease [Tropicimonas sp. TH_r6]|uniref:amino acid permease n=1 Tax=Tropicimonas sp. TH_r6 TaxID=3082085 RepID=UPI0029534FB9|nr:amino acid permease [Tropicimonas sp. TH_r6]MDV7142594.1 amino acid permease [Tropicimonas sp. TH_r6]